MYTISQVAEMLNIPVSTLRYYDKEGLFPGMKRESGIRKFSDNEINALRVIECLKVSGLEIREIKQFMEWTTEGSTTYQQRKQLFETRLKIVEEEMDNLQKTMDMLKYKCWYYETAIQDGNEERIRSLLPDNLPPEIQKLYNNAFQLRR